MTKSIHSALGIANEEIGYRNKKGQKKNHILNVKYITTTERNGKLIYLIILNMP